MSIETVFENTPANLFRLQQKSSTKYQLIAPIFHEDGDMMSIFVEEDGNTVRISDNGISLMRLSYTFDVDTDNKKKQLSAIITAQNADNRNGDLILTVPRSEIYSGVMRYAQMVSQVCNLDILSRETVSDLFYDDLERAIAEHFSKYKFKKDYINPKYKDLPIDYAFLDFDTPAYLFGAKDTNKANQITICCLSMLRFDVSFKSIAVFNEIDSLNRFARDNLMNVANTVFSNVQGFLERGPDYFKNDLGAA
ncbi:MAG: DUF1828 domain-containing protein [Clostridiales Family XIII bacterium]|jgi:hypothetical protein|nr:DUF1828 domain-containing protein [Clostridiales Family XIII bacterium]